MAKWTEAAKEPDNPKARMWIFYGDGRGGFEKTTIATGIENHESRVADLDGDGDLDIVASPTTSARPGWTSGSIGGQAEPWAVE